MRERDGFVSLCPELDRLVDDWWKAVKPAFMKRDAEAMLRNLTNFWDLHPGLVPYLELEMEFLFELGAELGRRKEWPRYADVLLRLRELEAFLCRTCLIFFHYDGVLTASAIEAMGHFADYLLACGALGEQEHLALRKACRTLYRQALTTYESNDPVPRLMPELLLGS